MTPSWSWQAPRGRLQPMQDFVTEAFRHRKAVGAVGPGVDLLQGTALAGAVRLAQPGGQESDRGVVTSRAGSGPGQLPRRIRTGPRRRALLGTRAGPRHGVTR